MPQEGTFAEWTDRLRAYNEFVGVLGEYKLNVAKAEYERARTAEKYQLMAARQIVIKELQRAMNNLHKHRSAMDRQIKRIEKRRKEFKMLLQGRYIHTATYNVAKAAFYAFVRDGIGESEEDFYEIKIPNNARPPVNFVNCKTKNAECERLPDDIDNVLSMMDWCLETQRRYIPKMGRPAQRALAKLCKGLGKVAKSTQGDLQKRINAMQNNTYKAWQPLTILGVQASSVATTIQNAGASGGT